VPKGRRRKQPEWSEQRWLYHHVRQLEGMYPVLKLLHHVPNAGGYSGGHLSNKLRTLRLIDAGLRAGWPDNEMPVARGGSTGLAIELKAPGKLTEVSEAQCTIHRLLQAEGWLVTVRDRWQHAWNDLVHYLPELPAILAISFVPPTLDDLRKLRKHQPGGRLRADLEVRA
jgi:hypothetical protein